MEGRLDSVIGSPCPPPTPFGILIERIVSPLIFTTHNTIYMDMDLLRRDEIWFVEKDNGVSKLYSLDDITNEKGEKVRKDSNYEKHYLLGNYGAIPNLKNLLGRK